MVEQHEKPSRINTLLSGSTGHGKSNTGNIMSGRQAFIVSDRTDSETAKCQHCDYSVSDHTFEEVRAIDNPGFNDTKMPREEVNEEFIKFSDRAPEGIHAFLFVVNSILRWANDIQDSFRNFENYCGDEAWRRTILVLTFCSEGDLEGQKARLQQGDASKFWLEKMGGGVVVADNNDREGTRQRIHQAIQRVLEQTDGRPWTNEPLRKAEDWRRRMLSSIESLDEDLQAPALNQLHLVAQGQSSRADAETTLQTQQSVLTKRREDERNRVEAERRERDEWNRAEEEKRARLRAEEAERRARLQAEEAERNRAEAERRARLQAEQAERNRVEAERRARLQAEEAERNRAEAERNRAEAERRAMQRAEEAERSRLQAEQAERNLRDTENRRLQAERRAEENAETSRKLLAVGFGLLGGVAVVATGGAGALAGAATLAEAAPALLAITSSASAAGAAGYNLT